MPRKSFYTQIPQHIQKQLDSKLVEQGFSGYYDIADWLNGLLEQEGLEIRVQKSAINNYGREFEEKLRTLELATRQAQAIVEGTKDDAGAMAEALTRLAQEKSFRVLMQLDADELAESIDFTKLIRSVSDLNRSSISVKKFASEVALKLETARNEIGKEMRGAGVTAETQRKIDELLGAVL